MARFRHMVSMERTEKDKAEAMVSEYSPLDLPDVPYGLCISLSEIELEKLNLDDDCEVGDLVHLFAMGKVTSVSKTDTGSGCRCRVEISLIALEVEDEDDEGADGEDRRR